MTASFTPNRFGLPHKIVMSQRDVPGVTRGVVPLLASRGVRAFSEGANGAFTSPQVPLLFNWTDAASGSSVLYLNHPSGYGEEAVGAGGDRRRRRLLSLTDAVSLEGFDEALIFAFRGDNGGPQSVSQAQANLGSARSLFPNAKVVGSTLDAWVGALLKHGTETLPVVTSEIGDTWIYGLQADPWKTKAVRLMLRERARALALAGPSLSADAAFRNQSRYLVKATEHTFGETHGRFDEHMGWSNQQLQSVLTSVSERGDKYRNYTASWSEQREYVQLAVDSLVAGAGGGSAAAKALHGSIVQAFAAAAPRPLPPAGFTKHPLTGGGMTAKKPVRIQLANKQR